jgi:hypothetical protein
VSGGYFHDILGVADDATREEIRRSYRRRVMENHPDRFPHDKKALQELTMITLTEAYAALMGACAEEPVAAGSPAQRGSPSAARAPSAAPRARSAPDSPRSAGIAAHGDPAYAYYKQGFINFSLAIHGIAEINRKIAAGRVPRFTRRYTAAEDIAGSLGFLKAAHGYFSRVINNHRDSVWGADSRAKLRRIERFTRLYVMILGNLKSR